MRHALLQFLRDPQPGLSCLLHDCSVINLTSNTQLCTALWIHVKWSGYAFSPSFDDGQDRART
jgi:hypothetical protein